MKTLSIKQPWANLIATGKKNIENRTWKTNYRGKILIHATKYPKGFDKNQINLIETNMTEEEYNASITNIGCIIGEVEIIDCVRDSQSKWAEKDCWNWVLKNPILYDKPIENVKGKLMLWDYGASDKETDKGRI